ncbi:hypothetical protein STEG23_018344 [Scotinomys teguina]
MESSASEWIMKLWYINKMECYSALKINKILSPLAAQMKPEAIMSSKVWGPQRLSSKTLLKNRKSELADQQDPVWVPECLVRRIPEDRKAEDVASMDDVGSAEPAVVDDIGPVVPPEWRPCLNINFGPC